jgi:uncharacterized protein (TIGR01244 family)
MDQTPTPHQRVGFIDTPHYREDVMEERIEINDQITVGSQPSKDDIERLAKQGFKSVFNLRAFDEDEQPMQPDEEGQEVKGCGMEYHHLSVVPDEMDEETVDQFREEMDRAPKPAFVHCKSGKRSGAFTMMKIASERGMSGEQTLEEAERMGFECDTERLESFVRDYVNSHTSRGGSGWATGEEVGPRV